ncbi:MULTISPECIES: type 1 glutamine amidotransferase [Brevibacterium]|uniref:GMP synthase - Glutamine amidotransferase n=2 Tax=Brevibacterium antiquum TaxID=234835 RepID=A0A2H1I966_9MICO|nr:MULTISPECIES: type 1 glutamine amidotransferase [Brevibacterium]SMX71656.1 GMP synthase - Glutamine amidotransferase [Brevibacterium antiquum CNRZ 918]SMX80942.1 GMP synthase - Glutamine amidotransferase [Brevibacterium antiquum]HCG54634.1 type 1 glutamine amidotransferase [Brevibacterium sp.]
MSELRILVIEHEAGAGLERFGNWLTEAGAETVVLRPYLGDEIPNELDDYAALLVLGGSAGPFDDADNPWLPQVRNLLQRSVAGEFPSFNICLGGELLAAATSAKIVRRDRPQIGIYDLHTTSAGEADPVFAALADFSSLVGEAIPAVLFHQEEMELPDGGELLLTGSDAPVQGYRVGEFAWGTQFHPETDEAEIEQWLESDPLQLPAGKTTESIKAEVAEADAQLIRINRALAHSFVHYLLERQRAD